MTNIRPWEPLKVQIEAETPDQIKDYLDSLSAEDINLSVSHLNDEERGKLLALLQPKDAAELIDDLPWAQALKMIEELNAKEAAAIISEMRSDEQVDFLGEMDEEDAQAILTEMDEEEVESVKRLILYDSNTAGGLMITEFLAFDESQTVGEVVKDLSENSLKYEKYSLQYIYVTRHNKFSGVLQMRGLLLSKHHVPLSQIMLRDAVTVNDLDTIDELIDFFDTHDLYGAPVLNNKQNLIGVVLRKDIREAEAEIATVEHLETQGIVGGEELRTMPVLLRSKRRLSWLSVNILLNILAASIIALYQDVLASVIALAVFLPIISDMSGCSGNQAVAVSLRELSLGVVKPFEVARVWLQEVSVGLINGLVLGVLIGFAAWFWKGNVYLGLVAGAALALNTIIAVSIGGTIPLILKRFNIDPALASGPILTTITDMLGFFLALTFAGMALSYLT